MEVLTASSTVVGPAALANKSVTQNETKRNETKHEHQNKNKYAARNSNKNQDNKVT